VKLERWEPDVVVVACEEAVRMFRSLGLPVRGYERPADALLAIAARPPNAVVVGVVPDTRGGADVGDELRRSAATRSIPVYGVLPRHRSCEAWAGFDTLVSDEALHVLPELALRPASDMPTRRGLRPMRRSRPS
jgi:hypothetical protein